MKFKNTRILAIESFLPTEMTTSDDIEENLSEVYQKLKLPIGRLEMMTGIKERRLWPSGTRPSDLSTNAAEKIFKTKPQLRDKIDLLIHSSVCRDFLEPSTASVIHANLSLKTESMIFDLSNACLGAINAIVMAAHMIDAGTIKHALIVTGENGGPLLEETTTMLNQKARSGELNRKNIKKYIANLTIGSAATAILLGSGDLYPQCPEVLGGAVCTDSSANDLCRGDGSPHSLMMETDSEALLHKGIALAKLTWQKAKDELGWNKDSLDWVLTHQVGKAHEELTLNALEVNEVPTFRTYPYLGNTGSSALPVTLEQLISNQTTYLKNDDHIALMGIGSGLTSMILGVRWGKLL